MREYSWTREYSWIAGTDVVRDNDGNSCSAQHFGSKEAALEALKSLKNCSDCVNCRNCVDCVDCYKCENLDTCARLSYVSNASWTALGTETGTCTTTDRHVPVIQNIHRAVLDAVTTPGNYCDMSDWHTCDTTHCRAGWVVTLAGPAGKRLEDVLGTELAAMLIYKASSPLPLMPRAFYEDTYIAMQDILRMAELEEAQSR